MGGLCRRCWRFCSHSSLQVDKSANFKKPDGRRYKIHERRLNPAPKPVTKPSLYLDPPTGTDMSPNAHARKHDYVTFLTMGELGPGPTLRAVAEKAVGLQDRLDAINDRNVAVEVMLNSTS